MMYDEDKEDIDEMMYDEDKEEKMEEANLDEEIDLEEILNELELEEAKADDEKTVDEAKDKDEKDSMEEAKDEDDDKKMEEAKDKDEKDSMEEAKDDKEENLEENKPIYKADDVQTDHMYKADYVNEGEDFDLDSLLEEINNLDEKKEDDEVNEAEEPVEEAKEETNEAVGALAGIAGLVAAAGGMAKLKMMFSDPEVQMKYPTANRVLNALEDAGSAAGQAMRRENEEMAEELEETKKALETVKGELNEVNLLNSKLLYVNRIFKANNLEDPQKLRVVETLDKAESIKEAKLIYETIKDSFNISKSTSVKRTSKKSIKEGLGMASKAVGTSTAPKKEVISESNNMIKRFQKLANIKIKE